MKIAREPLLKGAGVFLNIAAILALATEVVGIVLLVAFSSYGPNVLLGGSVTYLAVFGIAVLKAVQNRKRTSPAGNVQT
jgi:hypothetical protein